MRREKPVPCFDHQILAVVDLGDKADYRPEVRFKLSLSVPFRLTGRSGIRQLQEAYQQVFKALHHILPTFHRRLHIWLIDDETAQPTLFLSGLMGVRQGQLTKKQAERRDAKIRPQVTCPRPTKQYEFLLNTTAHSWGDPEEFDCEEDASDEDREYAVLSGIFGGFDHYELTDADHADVDCVGVTAELWHRFTLDLPFEPNEKSTESQLGYILGHAEKLIREETCGDLYCLQTEEADVWLLDETGQPTEFVSGLMQVKEGSLPVAEMKKIHRRSLERIPYSTDASRLRVESRHHPLHAVPSLGAPPWERSTGRSTSKQMKSKPSGKRWTT